MAFVVTKSNFESWEAKSRFWIVRRLAKIFWCCMVVWNLWPSLILYGLLISLLCFPIVVDYNFLVSFTSCELIWDMHKTTSFITLIPQITSRQTSISHFSANQNDVPIDEKFLLKGLKASSHAVLHMSQIECKWEKSFVLRHKHSIRLMWLNAPSEPSIGRSFESWEALVRYNLMLIASNLWPSLLFHGLSLSLWCFPVLEDCDFLDLVSSFLKVVLTQKKLTQNVVTSSFKFLEITCKILTAE